MVVVRRADVRVCYALHRLQNAVTGGSGLCAEVSQGYHQSRAH